MINIKITSKGNIIEFYAPESKVGELLKNIKGEGDTINFSINIKYSKQLQLIKIMESGHKIKNWCITCLETGSKTVTISAIFTKQSTISIEYNNFLCFNSL